MSDAQRSFLVSMRFGVHDELPSRAECETHARSLDKVLYHIEIWSHAHSDPTVLDQSKYWLFGVTLSPPKSYLSIMRC